MKQYSIQTHPINQANIEESCKLAASLRLEDQKLLALLNQKSWKYPRIFHAQTTFAQELNTTRRCIQGSLNRLKQQGIVSWTLGHEPTCTYTIHPLFRSYSVRKILYDKIKNLIRLAIPACLLLPSSTPDGALLNVKGLFIYKNDTMRESISTHARAGDAGIDHRFLKKEREVMEPGTINPIKQSIRDIKSIKLTKWGQIMLMAYPDEALKHADAQMKQSKSPSNPYGLFLSLCSKYCSQHGYDKDWRTVNFLKETYAMPDNAPMILETPKPEYKPQKREGSDFSQQLAAKIEIVNQEDPFEAALKIERYRRDNPKLAAFGTLTNPWLNRLQEPERNRIIDIINNEKTKEEK